MNPKVSIEKRKMYFEGCFKEILRARDQSDRTSLIRITRWLGEQCEAGKLDEEIVFGQVLNWAREVAVGETKREVRNPWAVLMSILKKELGYGRK